MTNSPIKVRDHKKPLQTRKHMRICADCGFKDTSIIPPTKCPRCHNQPKNPLNEQALEARPLNRAERRKQAVERRQRDKEQLKLERKVNAQIARENPSGQYEAS